MKLIEVNVKPVRDFETRWGRRVALVVYAIPGIPILYLLYGISVLRVWSTYWKRSVQFVREKYELHRLYSDMKMLWNK